MPFRQGHRIANKNSEWEHEFTIFTIVNSCINIRNSHCTLYDTCLTDNKRPNILTPDWKAVDIDILSGYYEVYIITLIYDVHHVCVHVHITLTEDYSQSSIKNPLCMLQTALNWEYIGVIIMNPKRWKAITMTENRRLDSIHNCRINLVNVILKS